MTIKFLPWLRLIVSTLLLMALCAELLAVLLGHRGDMYRDALTLGTLAYLYVLSLRREGELDCQYCKGLRKRNRRLTTFTRGRNAR
jgi:hypothetical protein